MTRAPGGDLRPAAHLTRRPRIHRLAVGVQREDLLLSEDGDTFVIQAGPEFKVLGKNPLNEMALASPAIAHGSLILRTQSKLYRIAKTESK